MEINAFLELLLLDENNPRSPAYQTARSQEHVAKLPRDNSRGQLGWTNCSRVLITCWWRC